MSSSQQSANETAATGMIVVEPGQGTQMGHDLRLLGRAEWNGGDFMVIDQVVPPRRRSGADARADLVCGSLPGAGAGGDRRAGAGGAARRRLAGAFE
jgi:hypothetical protein